MILLSSPMTGFNDNENFDLNLYLEAFRRNAESFAPFLCCTEDEYSNTKIPSIHKNLHSPLEMDQEKNNKEWVRVQSGGWIL
jgi:hypothetical protein